MRFSRVFPEIMYNLRCVFLYLHFHIDIVRGVFDSCDAEVPRRVAHSRVKNQPRVDETLRWKVPPDPGNPADQVSSAAVRNHSTTRAGGEAYVSSKQTPSN